MLEEASGPDSLDVALEGQVVGGRGLAAPELVTLTEQVQAIVKEPLCPGSLNVVLNRPVRLLDAAGFAFDGDYRILWRAAIGGINVWLYRWRESPLHVVEILSSVHLREHLRLKNGDTITLRMSRAQIGVTHFQERFIWAALWTGRRRWFYSYKLYSDHTVKLGTDLGATQEQPTIRGPIPISLYVLKEMVTLVPTAAFKDLAHNLFSASKRVVTSTPVIGALAKNLKHKYSRKYAFSRFDTENCKDADERVFRQIQNVLNFTKTSNSHYSAEQFPAAYHTINVNGRQVSGQRDPGKRLASVPIDFRGKSVLDLGCNQGGMIHQIRALIKWGVGIDYDPRMINAANRIKSVNASDNIGFYIVDLQNDPLDLIADFMPEQKADVCFLLSVCMWLKNWQQVIDFAASKSKTMLFETNGSALQQDQQINYLKTKYSVVNMLSEISDDDPIQKFRKLIHLTEPI
ncbi:MAG TPA: methyltransferase domain-containing protein [Steroidobacteraceae bacterium]|jgi:SAM-dependent methyltransferase